MADPSLFRTLVAQVCLCVAFYLALNTGKPTNYDFLKVGDGSPLDFYFISVWGGLRSVKEETLLLKQMGKMAKVSHAKFVLHIREPGENDHLMQSGLWYFSSLKVPWHSIWRGSRGNDRDYFIERIKLRYGRTLDIISIDTGLLKESVAMGSASNMVNSQLLWLKRTLQSSNSNWRIVVGFHPLVTCENNTQLLETKHLSSQSIESSSNIGMHTLVGVVAVTMFVSVAQRTLGFRVLFRQNTSHLKDPP